MKRVKVCDGGCGKTSDRVVIRKVTVAGQTYRFCAECEWERRVMTTRAFEVEALTRQGEPENCETKVSRREPVLNFCAGFCLGAVIMFFLLAIV